MLRRAQRRWWRWLVQWRWWCGGRVDIRPDVRRTTAASCVHCGNNTRGHARLNAPLEAVALAVVALVLALAQVLLALLLCQVAVPMMMVN